MDPYPEYRGADWYQTDDVYLGYTGNGYYLYDRRYPDRPGICHQHLALNIQTNAVREDRIGLSSLSCFGWIEHCIYPCQKINRRRRTRRWPWAWLIGHFAIVAAQDITDKFPHDVSLTGKTSMI